METYVFIYKCNSYTNITFLYVCIIIAVAGPSAPQILVAENVSPGKVKLEWGPPRHQNGIITYYIIYYTPGNPSKRVPDDAWSSIHQNGR